MYGMVFGRWAVDAPTIADAVAAGLRVEKSLFPSVLLVLPVVVVAVAATT